MDMNLKLKMDRDWEYVLKFWPGDVCAAFA